MRTLISDWTFHKAGQGLFYSGCIKSHKDNSFWFVFDCGTVQGATELKSQIKDFKSRLLSSGREEIDLLVISHFDNDHINQISLLLKNLTCKLAVLPYVSTLERLELYFHKVSDDVTEDDDYFQFLSDPTTYLTQRGVQQIIYLDGNDNQDVIVDLNPLPDPENRGDLQNSSNDIPLDLRIVMTSKHHSAEQHVLTGKNKNVKVKKAGRAYVGNAWEFTFHQIKRSFSTTEAFKDTLRTTFDIELSSDFPTAEELQKIMSKAKLRKELKATFTSYFGDTNPSSIVVLHGPIRARHSAIHQEGILYEGKTAYTLLTADCDLHDVTSTEGYIKDQLSLVRIFQVPHHGSKKSWGILTDTSGLKETHALINYGTKNSHGHPDQEVLDWIALRSPDWKLENNTEFVKFSYFINTYI